MKADADHSGFDGTTSTTSSALLGVAFIASAVATVHFCGVMGASMPMPGGWSMSMAWMRMPGQTWTAAFAMFVAMWSVMMIAMMLPAVAPLMRTTAIAAGYFAVWTAIGIAVYPFGVAFAAAAMRSAAVSRAMPFVAGLVLVFAGIAQCTRWKARRLECCRVRCGASMRGGVGLGILCAICCLPLMSAFLVAGVMDLRVMAGATIAIAAERVARRPRPVVLATGVLMLAFGTALLLRAIH